MIIPFSFMKTAAGGGGGGPTYLVNDDLEYVNNAAATSAGWTLGSTPTFGYTTAPAPLQGTYSVMMNSSSDSARVSFTAQSDVWIYLLYHTASSTATNMNCIIEDAGAADLATFNVIANGAVRANSGGGTNNDSATGVIVTGQVYHFWVRYTKGSGANALCEIYHSTDGVKPGSPTASQGSGTSTADATTLVLHLGGSVVSIFDKIRISASVIGDNPT